MKQFKCPECGELQEVLTVEFEIVGSSFEYVEVGQDIEDLIENQTIGAQAECDFCSYTGDYNEFKIVDSKRKEDLSPLKGQVSIDDLI